MSIKPVLKRVAIAIMFTIFGIYMNPNYTVDEYALHCVFIGFPLFGIPLFLHENWYRIIHLMQRKKRMEQLRIQGYYQTRETTDIYYHKILDCPFLFKTQSGGSRSSLIPESRDLSDLAYPCDCVEWVDDKEDNP